jgi:hypothetical protein
MKAFIAKIDFFDPDRWPVLSAPYKRNPVSEQDNITHVALQLGEDGLAILVGSRSGRTAHHHKRKLLGMIRCHMALYETRKVVNTKLVTSAHFTRADGDFRMPYCVPFSQLWVCRPPLKDALLACGDELVDQNNRRAFFLKLTDQQAAKATDMIRRLSGPPKNLPRPGQGFIRDI